MKKCLRRCATVVSVFALTQFSPGTFTSAVAAPVPGGTLDPLTIPKYVTPLVIPPVMPKSTVSPAPAADYDIAVRQFKQQILPGGIWGSTFPNQAGVAAPPVGPLPATTVWSYGRAADPPPDSSGLPGGAAGVAPAMNSTFNYPAFTVENASALPTNVRWINDLVDSATGNFLPHLFNVDQTLHWANPPNANCNMGAPNRTDCHTDVAAPYTGPVPLVTHVHGAHVQPHSDGYPEAWWLPGAPGTKGIPASYAGHGSVFTQANNANTVAGSALYSYENSQPATTLWYHDHALGMTRLNVYAGPAGFWLIRGGAHDLVAGLPGPAPSLGGGDPNFNATVRNAIREIPLAIQDRSFNLDGSLFYPPDRIFFDGFTGPFIGNAGFTGPFNPGPPPTGPSDMSGIWNPEAFFNTIVVNGTTWPKLDVANARYRLRLLDGCNSRTLNLSMHVVTDPDGIPGNADDVLGAEIPFYQIGAEQGFLPQVVQITTGFATPLPGNGTIPAPVAAADPAHALLMGPAERADVIVDFTGIQNGTRIRMVNTAPDMPFGGFPTVAADPLTSGQVMDFIVNAALTLPSDATTTLPQNLVLPAEAALAAPVVTTRQVSLNEMDSAQVCVEVNPLTGAIIRTIFSTTPGDPTFMATCAASVVAVGNVAMPAGPRLAMLGVVAPNALGSLSSVMKMWNDPITEIPFQNSTEIWEIYNTTVDGHPIHLHLVRFEVVNRETLDPAALLLGNLVPTGVVTLPKPNEMGYKDTVIAMPGQITRIKAKFDIEGLYVWHCHIVEHEDNEMMRPYTVNSPLTVGPTPALTAIPTLTISGTDVDPNGIQSITVNGIPVTVGAGGAFSIVITLAQGLNTITIVATDLLGNVITVVRTVILDTLGPTLTVNATPALTNTAALTVSGTVTDPNGVQSLTVNGTAVTVGAGGAFSTVVTLVEGSNTITIVATDMAGNVTTVIRTVILDTLGPTLTVNATPALTNTAALTVSGTVTDPNGVQSLTVNGTAVTVGAGGAFSTVVTLVPGSNTITVVATDMAGNITTVIRTVRFPELTGDGKVDRADLAALLAYMRSGKPFNPVFDLNSDGKVDLLDARLLSTIIN